MSFVDTSLYAPATQMPTIPLGRLVLQDVRVERLRQDAKWGEQNHDPTVWLAILTEEVGEVAKEIADGRAAGAPGGGIDLGAYRAELVQVAAVAVAAIEALDRGMS